MTADNQAYYGQAVPTTYEGEYNEMRFVITQQIAKLETCLPVRVDSVQAAGVAPVGTVKVTVLVNTLSGDNKPYPGATIENVPYIRLQGGSNAVIIDPKPGDIGLACFCSRDITAVKNARKAAPPGSKRHHNFSDAVYLGGMLNAAPTQYIHFTDSGIVIHSPNAVKVEAPTIEAVATTSAKVQAPSVSIGAGGSALRAMIDERIIAVFNGHTHPSNGAVPTQQITNASSVSTSATKAN